MNTIAKYASLVKFSHTIFALPFALVGYVYALVATGTPFRWLLLVQILLCMVLARNAAMGFNRWADRRIDARNPRTAGREIPTGAIPARRAAWFVAVNAVLFVVVAGTINPLTLWLSPVALLVLLGYSLTKRFTAWCHVVLGVALGIAPAGAYIAVTGRLALVPVILSGLVITWCGGFDVLYAMQDEQVDRREGLHSVPARFGARGAVVVSILMHLVTVYAVVLLGVYMPGGLWYRIGAGLFVLLLVWQHVRFTPQRMDRIGASFGLMNGMASVVFAVFAIVGLILAA
ncbi:MAG: UbiA family prenyltransferase [Rikenellaceae bacterium]|nr:UbiA family prenyltransferase [Rikenellaceae bacterium]